MVELNSMFHLRRVQFQTFVKEKGGRPLTESINDGLEEAKEAAVLGKSTMILLDKQTKIGRNPELVDVVLHSVVHSNMISRDHSEIIGEFEEKEANNGLFARYFISDRSLNGTYVNDTRVKDSQLLKEGDLIKFGHVNGAAIKPGEFAPQQSAEFIFRFERALPTYSYFGYTSKGIRVQSEHRRAYMQINSDRVLPTEVYSSSTLAGQKLSIGAPGPGIVNNSNENGNGNCAVNSSNSGQIPLQLPVSAVTSIATLNANATAAFLTPTHPSAPANQLAHLAAVAAATTQNAAAASIAGPNLNNGQQTTTASGTAQHQQQIHQQQQTLNALNQLGRAVTDEQVAAMNAQLRSLMASHDAMSAMERLAAQQQWQKSLLNLNSIQQQNPLIYGHAFPAAAAAAAALFTGIGGIDLNSAAANPAAAQYAAAASLWPNIRATLQQPTAAATAQDWSQQQKAAAIAQQLQLRLPGNLYQPQPQQQPNNSNRVAAASAVTVASSLFGAPSAFSLPGSHPQNQANSIPSSSNNNNNVASGLLIAHTGQQHPSTSSSSSSAAYSSCTSSNSQPPGIRPAPLSRGASSSSIGPNLVPTTTDQALSAAAAQLAAARQLAKEALEGDQAKAAGWPSIGISCTSASGTANPNSVGQKVSPIVARMSGAFQGTPPVSSGQLQRIPGIASALAAAAAMAVAQQQQVNGGGGGANSAVWQASGTTPPVIPTPTPSATPGNLLPLGTPPAQQPLAQRLLSSSNSSLSLMSGTSKSSSGVSSLQSPNAIANNASQMLAIGKNEQNNFSNFRDSLSSSSACTSSLNISGTSSAFSTPAQQQNSTNLSTLTAAMFAAEEAAKRQQGAEQQQQQQMIGHNSHRRASTGGGLAPVETTNAKEKIGKATAPISKGDSMDRPVPVNGPSNGQITIAADLNQLQIENKNVATEESKNGGRQLMECDSSVPSPPSKQDDELLARPSSSTMSKEEEMEGEDCKADTISRKRHSDSGEGSLDRPKPMKQPRKSNEVARLLNDLTAGNCSWQYMAEKQQQKVAQTSKTNKMASKNDKIGRDRKKPLRLNDRKQLEIEKKKAHKMMRQISDSESSSDEHLDEHAELNKNNNVTDSEDEGKNDNNIGIKEKQKRNRRKRSSSSASSDSIPTFGEFLRDEVKKETGKSFSNGSDSDNEPPALRKGGKPMGNKNGNLQNGGGTTSTGSAGKRKLLSSAPTKKPVAAKSLVNGHNGETETTIGKKRGPKPVEEKKGPGRTRKNTLTSTNSTVAASTRSAVEKKMERGKPGRKAGTGRGRKAANAASDNEDDEKNNSAAESDLGDERPVTNKPTMNGAVKGKRGRKAGTAKKGAAAETENTIMEDWTGGKGDPEKCAHSECKRPKDMSINWVQCDDCDEWFHSICVFGKNTMPEEDDKWFCAGCHPNFGNVSVNDSFTSNNSSATLSIGNGQ